MKQATLFRVALLLAIIPACTDDTTTADSDDTDGSGTTMTPTTMTPTTMTPTTMTPTTMTPTTGDSDSTGGDPTDTMTGGSTDGEDTDGEDTDGSTGDGSSSGGGAMCGNDVAEGAEQCDGTDLNEGACLIAGDVTCAADCTLDMSACVDVVVVCSTPAAAIDAGTTVDAPFTDTVTINNDAFVTDVNVQVSVTHPFVEDVIAAIVSPDLVAGSQLTDGQCGSADDIDATFDDEGVVVACGVPAFSGSVLPTTPLNGLVGINAMGDWTFVVYDQFSGLDDGVLDQWCMELTLSDADPVVCGDGALHYGEVCDGAELNGTVCTDIEGFVGGELACDAGCAFDTTGCIAPPANGDTCAAPILIDEAMLPYSDTSDTLLYNNNYGFSAGVCPGETGGWNAGAEEVVYAFTPAADGDYEMVFDTAWDSVVYVSTDCADIDSTCVGGADNGNPETVTATLTGGTTYYIMGGHFSNASLGGGGAYTLTVTAL